MYDHDGDINMALCAKGGEVSTEPWDWRAVAFVEAALKKVQPLCIGTSAASAGGSGATREVFPSTCS